MEKVNCWEFKNCGREPGGAKVADLGVCPVPEETRTNNVNGGKNGGRVCWAVAGSFCGGDVQGTFAGKLTQCLECDFYQKVLDEEDDFEIYPVGADIEE